MKGVDLRVSILESESHSVVSDSVTPPGLYSPWNSPGQNIGVGSLSLLQGDLPNPGIEARSPALQVDYLPAEPQGTYSYNPQKAKVCKEIFGGDV